MDFRRISAGFWQDFGVLFGRHLGEAFQVAGFTLRIRATRGRSTERQRDRESRPNPLKDQGDSSKAPRPAGFGRGAGEVHGFAKQASLDIPFLRVPG